MATIGELLAMRKGPVGAADVGAGGDPAALGDPSLADSNELPFGFRMRLQLARQDPKELVTLLKSQHMTLEPVDVSGRIIATTPDGKRYAIDQFMPGPAAIHYGPKIAATVATTANPAMGIGALALRSAAGSGLGTAYESGLRGALGVGGAPSTTDAAVDAGINMAADVAMRGAGGLQRAISGKRAMIAAEEQAIAKSAEAMALGQAALDQHVIKSMDDEAKVIAKEAVRREFADAYGVGLNDLAKLRTEDLPKLAVRTRGVVNTVGAARSRVFNFVSKQYNDVLREFAKNPVPDANFGGVVSAGELFAAEHSHKLSPALAKHLDNVRNLGGNAVPKGAEGINFANLTSGMSSTDKQALMNSVGGQPTPTIDQLRGQVTNLRAFASNASSSTERKIANDVADSINETVTANLPDDVAKTIREQIDPQWREANRLFGGKFRKQLNAADSPAAVAEVLVGAGPKDRTIHVQRTHQLLNNLEPNEMPAVRSAVAERITSATDPAKFVATIDPTVLRRLWPNTGLDKPEVMKRTIEGAHRLEALLQNPAWAGRMANAAQQAFDTTAGKQVLARNWEIGRRAAADIAAAKQTAAAKRLPMTQYLNDRTAFIAGLALTGSRVQGFGGPETAVLGLGLLGAGAMQHWLSNPKHAAQYVRMLESPTAEAVGNFVGRAGASAAAEYVKASSRPSARDAAQPVMTPPGLVNR